MKCDSLSGPQVVGGSDGLAAGAELFGGFARAGFSGGRRWHGGASGSAIVPGQRVVHLQGADPASPHRRGERQRAARPPAAQALAGARGGAGSAPRGAPGPDAGGAASVAVSRTRGSLEQWRDVVGGGAARAVI